MGRNRPALALEGAATATIRKLNRSGAQNIVWSRLLVLQSKRLMLSGVQRRLRRSGAAADQREADRLRADSQIAEDAYRASRGTYGLTKVPDYLAVAFRRIIDQGDAAVAKLRARTAGLAAAERFEKATDVQMLEELVEQWRESVKPVSP